MSKSKRIASGLKSNQIMNSFKMRVSFVLVFTLFFLSCISSNNTIKTDTTIVSTKITREGTLPSADWHIYKFPNETICIPSKWRFVDQKEYLFAASLNQHDSNSYFQVIKERKVEEGGMNYLKRLNKYLKQGLNGELTNYSAINTIYDDKNVFNCEFHLHIANQKYILMTTIFEKNKYLFEVRLVVPERNAPEYQQTYNNILYNFYTDDKLVFDIKDKIKKALIINLESS